MRHSMKVVLPIIIMVHCASDLFPAGGNSENSDPYCIITIGDQKQRTRQQKKTNCPTWKTKLSFTTQGIDPNLDIIKVEVKDANHKGFEMGRLELSFLEFCASIEGERWYRLLTENEEELPSCICLIFDIKGPGSTICSFCGLYIGEEESISVSAAETIHSKCLLCTECGKPKLLGELLSKNGRFYDVACFERRFGATEARQAESQMANMRKKRPGSISGKAEQLTPTHTWVVSTFPQPISCGLCGQPLKESGYKCQECAYSCHIECRPKSINSCVPNKNDIDTPKSSQTVPKGMQLAASGGGITASGIQNSSNAQVGASGTPKRMGLAAKKKK